MMKIPSGERSVEVNPAATEALSETEQHVLTALKQWGELFDSTSKGSGRGRKSKREGIDTKVNLDEVALQLIDEMLITLTELRSEIEKTVDNQE